MKKERSFVTNLCTESLIVLKKRKKAIEIEKVNLEIEEMVFTTPQLKLVRRFYFFSFFLSLFFLIYKKYMSIKLDVVKFKMEWIVIFELLKPFCKLMSILYFARMFDIGFKSCKNYFPN